MRTNSMVIMKGYILKELTYSFFTMFLPLFVIASMVFIVKLSGYTAEIEISFLELVMLYMYSLPELFFYTFPLTFFITATLSLYKLSQENEMLVLFALGVSPWKIYRIYLVPALVLCAFLIFNFMAILPMTKAMFRSFIDQKIIEGAFNLSASEYGHKYGKWMVFIGDKDEEENLYDITLFNSQESKETLVKAQKAKLLHKQNILSLELYKGKMFTYSEVDLKEMHFNVMRINNQLNTKENSYKGTIDFWINNNDREYVIKKFTQNSLIALFPLVSLFLVFSIGIINIRHSNAFVYIKIFIAIVLYFMAIFAFSPGIYLISSVIFVSLLTTYIIFNKIVLRRY